MRMSVWRKRAVHMMSVLYVMMMMGRQPENWILPRLGRAMYEGVLNSGLEPRRE